MGEVTLSLTSAIILQAIDAGRCYGFEIMDSTGLPSGTVYPALRRLESAQLIRSDWHASSNSESLGPPRRYYVLTTKGDDALATAGERYRLVARLQTIDVAGK